MHYQIITNHRITHTKITLSGASHWCNWRMVAHIRAFPGLRKSVFQKTPNVPPPKPMGFVMRQSGVEVKIFRVMGRFCTRITDVALSIQSLRNLG